MTPPELLALLHEFYRDKLTLKLRHEAGARLVPHYDFNNAYQYVIAREEVQLSWLTAAIAAQGGELPQVPAPDVPSGRGDALLRAVLNDDVSRATAFAERWRPRLELVTNARMRGMLRVILGETLEHRRFFEQALEGRTDLLGRRADGAGTGGGVLADRMTE